MGVQTNEQANLRELPHRSLLNSLLGPAQFNVSSVVAFYENPVNGTMEDMSIKLQMTECERLLVPYFTKSKMHSLTCLKSNVSHNQLHVIVYLAVFFLRGNFFLMVHLTIKRAIFSEIRYIG